jgi:hypothetical protein
MPWHSTIVAREWWITLWIGCVKQTGTVDKLYARLALRCPYALRAGMTLIKSGIAFDANGIVLLEKPAAMLVS